jgi:hypothetical protein
MEPVAPVKPLAKSIPCVVDWIVYLPVAAGLFASPLAAAMAWMVVVELIVIGPLYTDEDVVGGVPFSV